MKKRKDELEFVKKVSQHPRGHLKRELKKWSDELEFVKLIPQNPRDRLKENKKTKKFNSQTLEWCIRENEKN